MDFSRADESNLHRALKCAAFLLGELIAKLLFALTQIRFVTVGIDKRIRLATEQAFVFFHEMKEAPVRREENVAGQMVQ